MPLRGHLGDLKSILANKQVKRFHLVGYDDNFNEEENADHPPNIGYNRVAEIVAEHPWLEAFRMPEKFAYDRSEGYLYVATAMFHLEGELASLFRQCRPLRKLKLLMADREVERRMVTMASGALGGSVEELELRAIRARTFTAEHIFTIPLLCPQLRKLVIEGCSFSDLILQALASACPFLQHLSCEGIGACPLFSDAGMLALFQGCTGLQVLRFDKAEVLTFRTLQAIVDCRLRLKSLTLRRHNLAEEDFLQLRQLVKDAGLLPVLKIVTA